MAPPGWELPRLAAELAKPRGSRSLSSHIQSRTGIKGVKAGLLREVLTAEEFADPERAEGVQGVFGQAGVSVLG